MESEGINPPAEAIIEDSASRLLMGDEGPLEQLRSELRKEAWRAYHAGECTPMTPSDIEFEIYGLQHTPDANIKPLE